MSSVSSLKGFLQFLSSVKGDFANITAPPHFLAPSSVTEVSSCWSERPSVFAAPSLEADPEKRALLVLRWYLASLRSQYYLGGSTTSSLKKPLNAFLGEVFTAKWTDDTATVHLATEQVSHHPPITACCLWDEAHGIHAEGYARAEMTFTGNINIRQVGHAIVHIDAHDEDHLVGFPDANVKGFLSGRLYPELTGTRYVVSSSGFISEVKFSGTSLFGRGESNHFEATMYRRGDAEKRPLYVASGRWSDTFTIRDARTSAVVEEYDTNAAFASPTPAALPALEDQDAWESRRAWQHVQSALRAGDIGTASAEKSKIEKAQRRMRAEEGQAGTTWAPLLFRRHQGGDYERFTRLAAGTGWALESERTFGVWRVDLDKARTLKRPFRADLTPVGRPAQDS
ncbi:hypothetical protein E8E14_014761 [Neopestalotiopsis sp. 37M]|nr:hypothetical protein E8E14_014761 [Neopestalotiopsis sp. 37M]